MWIFKKKFNKTQDVDIRTKSHYSLGIDALMVEDRYVYQKYAENETLVKELTNTTVDLLIAFNISTSLLEKKKVFQIDLSDIYKERDSLYEYLDSTVISNYKKT